ncbi:unnamed protein product [Rotaria sp. Silwood1]|nr:unnamed protein product [Rotaria sp. Silwood1]CAF1287673.1 unnamed protein product [Rotaria sp. Silwood1]CAF3507992.1 unnamed protein product [Rotaria sp. Silwood1]
MKNHILEIENRTQDLEGQIEFLQKERKETIKRRTIAEMLIPTIKEIRTMMMHENIPDSYYTKAIINACLLHGHNNTISWEIADFNRANYPINFNINILYQMESIIKNKANVLNINYDTLLELMLNKIDSNEIEHDSIKTFFGNRSHNNVSFHSYLQSLCIIDTFNTNEKLCLEILYRHHFVDYYYGGQ